LRARLSCGQTLVGLHQGRYRGLAKNTARLFTAFALANLYLLRQRLLPPQWACLVNALRGREDEKSQRNRAKDRSTETS